MHQITEYLIEKGFILKPESTEEYKFYLKEKVHIMHSINTNLMTITFGESTVLHHFRISTVKQLRAISTRNYILMKYLL